MSCAHQTRAPRPPPDNTLPPTTHTLCSWLVHCRARDLGLHATAASAALCAAAGATGAGGGIPGARGGAATGTPLDPAALGGALYLRDARGTGCVVSVGLAEGLSAAKAVDRWVHWLAGVLGLAGRRGARWRDGAGVLVVGKVRDCLGAPGCIESC